jgi:hypothetical protein
MMAISEVPDPATVRFQNSLAIIDGYYRIYYLYGPVSVYPAHSYFRI